MLGDALRLIICLVVTLGVGFAGSLFTAPAVDTWYAALRKPAFTPPGWLFAPVWTALYVMMAAAAFLVWRVGAGSRWTVAALTAFAVQLGLNFLWSVIFFGWKQPGWAMVDIIALWIMIAVTMALFARLSALACWLLAPYIIWVTFASVLNFEIWRLNP